MDHNHFCKVLERIVDELMSAHSNLDSVMVGTQRNDKRKYCFILFVQEKGVIPSGECDFKDEPLLSGFPYEVETNEVELL
jgi:hypothetical protein